MLIKNKKSIKIGPASAKLSAIGKKVKFKNKIKGTGNILQDLISCSVLVDKDKMNKNNKEQDNQLSTFSSFNCSLCQNNGINIHLLSTQESDVLFGLLFSKKSKKSNGLFSSAFTHACQCCGDALIKYMELKKRLEIMSISLKTLGKLQLRKLTSYQNFMEEEMIDNLNLGIKSVKNRIKTKKATKLDSNKINDHNLELFSSSHKKDNANDADNFDLSHDSVDWDPEIGIKSEVLSEDESRPDFLDFDADREAIGQDCLENIINGVQDQGQDRPKRKSRVKAEEIMYKSLHSDADDDDDDNDDLDFYEKDENSDDDDDRIDEKIDNVESQSYKNEKESLPNKKRQGDDGNVEQKFIDLFEKQLKKNTTEHGRSKKKKIKLDDDVEFEELSNSDDEERGKKEAKLCVKVCVECNNKTFTRLPHYYRHLRIVHKIEPFGVKRRIESKLTPDEIEQGKMCPLCSKTFSCHKHVIRHLRTVHNGENYPENYKNRNDELSKTCTICDTTFIRSDVFLQHCRNVHGTHLKKIKRDKNEDGEDNDDEEENDVDDDTTIANSANRCETCNCSFLSDAKRQKHFHSLAHFEGSNARRVDADGNITFVCSICNQNPTKNEGQGIKEEQPIPVTLNPTENHEEVSESIIIPVSFPSLKKLLRHKCSSHRGEKIVCVPCDMEFVSRRNYRDHSLTERHISKAGIDKMEKKFHCTRPNCDKSYMTARMLQKHLATHDSISRQPRICEKCGSQLASLSSLNKHLTTVHAHDDKFEELEPKRKRRRKRVKKSKEEENLSLSMATIEVELVS